MCGICGEIRFDGSLANPAHVERMRAAMRSRGPDGEGIWTAGRVSLGHRRLCIIDVSAAGHQPMVDDELQLAVVFNGCIYNHHQLRQELQAVGYRFFSTSDTEVVLKAFHRWGIDFVDHLVGMFAIALLDRRSDQVVLARDRLGIKPLYLAESPGRLRFASTLPALLAAGDVDTALDPVALHHYLSWHSIVPAPRTLLRGVRKLAPATVRVIEADGRSREHIYWQPRYERAAAPVRSARQWQDAIRDALRTAVERRLVSDVPVGVLLSGGVDSSVIVALLAELGVRGVPTFSIGFESAGGRHGDEFEWSDAVARQFGTDHHRIRISSVDLVDAVQASIGAMSEPMGSHDVVAFHLLSEQVAQHVKVVQSGQGADEILGGYAFYAALAGHPARDALPIFSQAFVDRPHTAVNRLLAPEYRCAEDVSREWMARQLDQPGAETALDAVLRLDVHALLVDDPVKRVDNMTMAWGLEARVPFLDHDLVALAAACPPELKLAQGGKGVLKDIARPMLPEGLVDRPKGYFPVPGVLHLDGEMLEHVSSALRSPAAKQRGLFQPEGLDALLAEPNRLTPSGANALWQLGVLELWLQAHDLG